MKVRIACLAFLLSMTMSSAPAARRVRSSPPDLTPTRAWRLAFVRDGDVWVANGDGAGRKRLIENAECPAWSPDRKQLAFARDGNVWVAEANGKGQRQVTSWPRADAAEPEGIPPQGRPIDIAWDRVRGLLTFSREEAFWVADSPKGSGEWLWGATIYQVPPEPQPHLRLQTLWTYTDVGTGFSFSYQAHPAWAPDGKRLAFARNGDIWLGVREPEQFAEPEWERRWDWDVTRIAAVARYDAPTYRASRENDGVTHLSWSPDGKLIAYSWERLGGSGTEEIHLLEVTTGKHRRIAQDGIDPCFSPDGRWVVYCGVGSEHMGIHAVSRDGKVDRLLLAEGEQPAW